MGPVIYLLLVLPASSWPMAQVLTRWQDPRCATWLLTGFALMAAGTSCGALGLLALAALVRVPFVADLGGWSVAIVGRGDKTSTAVSLLGGILLASAFASVVRRGRSQGQALCEAFGIAARLPGSGDVVVTSAAEPTAYAVPGWPGRVVVSRGMLDALDEPGRAALLAHERAHLSGRHYLFVSAVRLASAANPLCRPLVSAVRYSVERWADERAAEAVGDRRTVAATIACAARAARARQPTQEPLLALGVVSWTAAGPGPVPLRVAALLGGPPRQRVVLIAASVALIGLAFVCAVIAANDLQDLLSLAHAHRG
jgi:hypothetical protein